MQRATLLKAGLAIAVACYVGGCITIFRHVEVDEITTPTSDLTVATPLKAHLHDGRVVVFEGGAIYLQEGRRLSGAGTIYELDMTSATTTSVSIDSIAAIETFRNEVDALASAIGTVGATAVGTLVTAAATLAIFGSCPTVYADDALQAETFSHSISRLMESRDVDRLELERPHDSKIRLEIRNEALETHYINHLELLHATHESNELALSDEGGTAFLVGELRHPVIKDRIGLDHSESLRYADEVYYRTDDSVLMSSRPDDMVDFLILEVPRPRSDTAAIYVRGRSSLLTSVLLYDFMLNQGPRTLDYLGVDLESIGEAMALGALFREHFGIRVFVESNGHWDQVARLGMSGPVVSEHQVVKIAVPGGDVLRVRLDFLADSWRFDQIMIGERVREVDMMRIPISTVDGYTGMSGEAALSDLSKADTYYHVTLPGQSFGVTFETSDVSRQQLSGTYFLAAQGYYTEWIRRDWFDRPTSHFEPNDTMLFSLLQTWMEKRAWYEKHFFERRVPLAAKP